MQNDHVYMQRCLDLAILGEGSVLPNPLVGCVIVLNNKIVAEGYHQKFGEAHAEVNAFNNLPQSIDPRLCDVYVNLEPCAHFGKTPPCANLIIQKQPKRVIVGMLDPNPSVSGKGLAIIEKAGIEITLNILKNKCEHLNRKFVTYHTKKRPYITLKWAETADGFMGRTNDDKTSSRQISAIENKYFVHKLRAIHQAILVGANTANNDNPLLDVRYVKGANPIKIILSKAQSLQPDLKLFNEGETWVYSSLKSTSNSKVRYINLPNDSLIEIIQDLYSKNIQSLLIEGGSVVLHNFLKLGLWDEAIIIKSKQNWDKGLKAPFIGMKCAKTDQYNGDTIKYFKR